MTTVDGIRKFGFRRWYERALIESHAYLVTAFLGMIVCFAGIELIGEHGDAGRVALGYLAAMLGVALVAFGLKRYHRIIVLAEALGDRATCRRCNTYAAFTVLTSASETTTADPNDAPGGVWIKVRCRRCHHEWTM